MVIAFAFCLHVLLPHTDVFVVSQISIGYLFNRDQMTTHICTVSSSFSSPVYQHPEAILVGAFGRELILVAVRLFVIFLPFNWPPIRLRPPPSLSGVIKPNHLGHYSQQGHPSVDREVMKKDKFPPFFISSMKKFLWSCDCFQIDHN